MIDAKNYKVADVLKDGTAIVVRAIRMDDGDSFLRAFNNLDSESIYTRFFRYKSGLTDEELKSAIEVDFARTVALVVTISDDRSQETIIGGGRYVMYDLPDDGSRSAEIAFMVEEDYQGQGIASRILRHLIDIARDNGISRFEADVLAENRAMLSVFARSGLPMKKTIEEGTLHVTLQLSVEAA